MYMKYWLDIEDPNDIFEHYLSVKESDCTKIDTQLFDKKVDVDYTHIIDQQRRSIRCTINIILTSVAISLDCIPCKQVRRTVGFKENGTSNCTGSTGHSHSGYPGQFISKYSCLIKKGKKNLIKHTIYSFNLCSA